MTIRMAAIIRSSAYYPEIYAYKKFFEKFDGIKFDIIFSDDIRELLNYDADCYFIKIGFDSKFNVRDKNKIYIHDYTSCSTGSFPKIKNLIKRYFNYNADIKVFLNEFVMNEYGYHNDRDGIIRDMGVDDCFFYDGEEKNGHEFIYAGTIDDSRNISKVLYSFKRSGRNITLVGAPADNIYYEYKNIKNILFTGVLTREETAAELKSSLYGINITPAIYPFDNQTSTKTLEYCAANLKVVCNHNSWNEKFVRQESANFLFTEDFNIPEDIESFDFVIPSMDRFHWDKVINDSGLSRILFSKIY